MNNFQLYSLFQKWFLNFFSCLEKAGCLKTAIYVSRGTFWEKRNFGKFLIFLDFELQVFGLGAKNFQQDCQNSILRVQILGWGFFVKIAHVQVELTNEWRKKRQLVERFAIRIKHYDEKYLTENGQVCGISKAQNTDRTGAFDVWNDPLKSLVIRNSYNEIFFHYTMMGEYPKASGTSIETYWISN